MKLRYIATALLAHVLVAWFFLASAQSLRTTTTTLFDIMSTPEVIASTEDAPFIDVSEGDTEYRGKSVTSEFLNNEWEGGDSYTYTFTANEEVIVCTGLDATQRVADAIFRAGSNPIHGTDAYLVFWNEKECELESSVVVELKETVSARFTEVHEYVAVVPLKHDADEVSVEETDDRFAIIIPQSVMKNVFRCTRSVEEMEAGFDNMLQCRAEI